MSKCKKCLVATAVVGAALVPLTEGHKQAIQELKVNHLSGDNDASTMMKEASNKEYDYFNVDPAYDLLISGDGTRRRLKKKKNCVIL